MVSKVISLILLVCLMSASGIAADWPCYLGDAERSGLSPETLEFPLVLAWTWTPQQPPRPAWPEPGREMHRIDYDYAFQPVVADGRAYIVSSADDTVRALDLGTGETVWSFTTGGPVRFAPHVVRESCYLASDDGFVYSLNAATGKLVWRFRAALDDRQLIGNGRMISRWPCRTGVLIVNDVVYTTAGMWPSDGVYIYALDRKTGRQIWCNDTSGSIYMPWPHGGAYAISGVAPQGYLAASKGILLVPTGRSVPAGFDLSTGRFLFYHAAANPSHGGSLVTISGNTFFNPAHGGGSPERHVELGEYGPKAGDGMIAHDLGTGRKLWTLPSRHQVVCDAATIYVTGDGKAEAYALKAGKQGDLKWSSPHPLAYSLVLAGNAVLIGGKDTVTALSQADGKQLWQCQTEGQVRGLAVAEGRLLAGLNTGRLHCFAKGQTATTHVGTPDAPADAAPFTEHTATAQVVRLCREAGVDKGFGLVMGEPDAILAQSLARTTALNVVSVLTAAGKAEEEQRRLLRTGVFYGVRVAIQPLAGPARLPFASYFANVVIVSGEAQVDLPPVTELYRVLRPCGGTMLFIGAVPANAAADLKVAGVPDSEVHRRSDALEVRRGKLPDAFDWNSETTCDRRVKWPLELLWFGGPGPDRMVDRHWGAPTPIAANGRYFALGEYDIIAVDAYNGTELWSRRVGDLFAKRRAVPADDDNVYVNLPESCVQLDAQTGQVRRFFGKLPPADLFPLKDGEPSADVGRLEDLPAYARRAGRLPVRGDTDSAPERIQPVVAQRSERAYRRSYGCSKPISSAAMDFFRSGTVGFYDLPDDSGVRNFGGIKPGCGTTMVPALGLLISSEGAASCSCSYSFQTSFAMAPAAQRRNEDWALFSGKVSIADAEQVALNLGAPGDRRDDQGLLWMGFPRPVFGNKQYTSVPYRMEYLTGYGPHRENADRTVIKGTESPWIYCSESTGIKALTFDLLYYDPFEDCLAIACAAPPKIDGDLSDACWDGVARVPLTAPEAAVYMREDKDALYIAYERRAAVDGAGKPVKWRATTTGLDAPVWNDDSFELYLKHPQAPAIIHLGVAASGARYSGLWENAADTPPLDGIAIDGDPSDWQENGLKVNLFDRGTARFAWCDKGLLCLFETNQDFFVRNRAYTGMVVGAGKPEGREFPQFVLDCAAKTAVVPGAQDASKQGPQHIVKSQVTGERLVTEALFPWQTLDLVAQKGTRVCLPILCFSPEKKGAAFQLSKWAQPPFLRAGDGMCVVLRLAETAGAAPDLGSAFWPGEWVKTSWQVEEQPGWNGAWSSAATATAGYFRAEIAIPWQTLSEAGLDRSCLTVNFRTRGKIPKAPDHAIRSYGELCHVVHPWELLPRQRNYTVRLHFAELHDAQPGQRVFDVKIQGKVVLQDFDIAAAAGGPDTACSREITGIAADTAITVEFVPKTAVLTDVSVPVLSGIELAAEPVRR